MKLWNRRLIRFLPSKLLTAQHRDCCALRGRAWGSGGNRLRYVALGGYDRLYVYHMQVMAEMEDRGWKVNKQWLMPSYQGRGLEPMHEVRLENTEYPEHNMGNFRIELEIVRGWIMRFGTADDRARISGLARSTK